VIFIPPATDPQQPGTETTPASAELSSQLIQVLVACTARERKAVLQAGHALVATPDGRSSEKELHAWVRAHSTQNGALGDVAPLQSWRRYLRSARSRGLTENAWLSLARGFQSLSALATFLSELPSTRDSARPKVAEPDFSDLLSPNTA
jgi:hypothetical protein